MALKVGDQYASVSDDAKVLPDFVAIKACLESLG